MMVKHLRQSRCAFIVIKLKIANDGWFIMRKNLKWKDINFVGGHEEEPDKHNREKTAKRELLEEIPALRGFRFYELEKLTDELEYGPILSRSVLQETKYHIQFFFLRFVDKPKPLLESLHGRTLNILLSQNDLLTQKKERVSGLVQLLNNTLPGGLKSIPYSWSQDLDGDVRVSDLISKNQFEIAFD